MKALIFLLGITTLAVPAFAAEPPFSPKPYLDDYAALRDHVSRSYANLEYLLRYYKIDTYELNAKTIAAISAAKSDAEALDALNQFVNVFRDGHFQLKRSDTDQSKVKTSFSPIDRMASGEVACKSMEFSSDKNFAFLFPTDGVKVIEKADGEFPFLVAERGATRIGIIRIADFRDEVYSQVCIDVWKKYSRTLKAKCDEKCRDEFLHQEMRRTLVDRFYQVLSRVTKAKPKALIIDLTHNGGGTDWVKDITALLTEKKLVCGRRGFMKHPHYTKILSDDLSELKATANPDPKKIREAEAKLKISSEICDRTPLWMQKDFKLSCSAIAYSDGNTCSYSDLKFRGKRKYSGRLFFLVDDRTASAAEDIVARHLDSKTATIIGGHTRGSGCGYTNGGIKFTLPYSKLNVKVPDCIRERTDGTNEVVGIEPQIKMDMSKINERAFLGTVLDAVIVHLD